MSLTVALIFLFFACCLCVLLVRLTLAPIGYEDESGFHPLRREKRRQIASRELTDSRA